MNSWPFARKWIRPRPAKFAGSSASSSRKTARACRRSGIRAGFRLPGHAKSTGRNGSQHCEGTRHAPESFRPPGPGPGRKILFRACRVPSQCCDPFRPVDFACPGSLKPTRIPERRHALAVFLDELADEPANFAGRGRIHFLAKGHEFIAIPLLEPEDQLAVLAALLLVLLAQAFPVTLILRTFVYT